ncbi:MAG: HAMP domain-containing protein, partial [Ignavibacteriales bacterium]|nr:HAMP domain-containing protein [Ignavibacteriales bacterium]
QQVQTSFGIFQNESVDAVRKIAMDSNVISLLSNNSTTARTFFEQVETLSPLEQTIELFDSAKHLLCWKGNEGIQTDTLWLKSVPGSLVVQGPIYSFLVVVHPVVNNLFTIGYVVSKRLFDVNYPINNRFINAEVFSATFTSRLGLDVQFEFSASESHQRTEKTVAIPLSGIDETTICSATLPSVNLEEQKNGIQILAEKIFHTLFVLLLLSVVIGISSLQWLQQKKGFRLLWWTFTIWIVRYILVWFDIPSDYVHLSIFEPSLFASPFGFGIAKSIGDVFLTSLCLFATIVLLTTYLTRNFSDSVQTQSKRNILRWINISIFALGLPLLLRGFAAVIRSAVFDSTLSYYNPMYIIPPFSLGVMFVSLFLISLSLIVAGVVGISATHNFLLKRFVHVPTLRTWLIVAGIFSAGNLLFEALHPNPLFSLTERFGYLAGFFLCAITVSKVFQQKKTVFITGTVVLFSITSMMALQYPLDQQIHEFDRSHTEDIASNIIRPADNYLTILTRQALQELSHSEFINSFNETNPRIVKKLAFKAWAKSILGREGYNCSVTYYKNDGTIFSIFFLGAEWTSPVIHPDSVAFEKKVIVEERTVGAQIVNVYEGYLPIRNEAGMLEGGVAVEVSAGRQTLLGGETPEFLRNYSGNELNAYSRQPVISEYINNELSTSSVETFSLGRQLPEPVLESNKELNGLWLEEIINGQLYETFYFRSLEKSQGITWYSLSMIKPDISWHVYNILRVVLFYSLCIFIISLIYVLISFARGKQTLFSFRTKLIVAFFVVALIPTAILAYYNRQYAVQRAEQSIVEQLKRETTTIASALQRQWEIFTPFDLTTFRDQHAIMVANDVQIDFTVFSDAFEAASSKPELFRAELFDRRLSSDAYSNIVLQQKNFYTNIQTIGTLQYIVGYRPLLTDAGMTFGIIAVPTLFRLQEIDEEIIRRNAYLFGAFLFAMLIALLVGFIFSHQISSPVRRLHQATKKIGAGDFDVQIRSNRSDEFGELEQAFDTMLSDLKHSQTEIIKAQRELAWKEMAKQVAHEIKNPLTPMKLSIQHLRQAYFDHAKNFDTLLHQVTGTILEQIETLSRIASEFSHFGRMPERKTELCNVHHLLTDVTNLFKEHSGVTFDLQFCPNSPIISADKEELRRAFMNIVRNSVQAMNEQGMIVISTFIADPMVNINFRDTGPGISKEARGHLFEPNFSTKTDGMGLGLAIVKKTIDDLGGVITVESETGDGTTVKVQLRLSSQQSGSMND